MMYNRVMDLADNLNVDVPASPIDAIRHELTRAGYSVARSPAAANWWTMATIQPLAAAPPMNWTAAPWLTASTAESWMC